MEIRALKLEEMEAWFDHCMYSFNNGEYNHEYRQEFINHWKNDPWRDLDSILVAVEDEEILSTVRVFHRNIYLFGEKVSMGGIGEVCTKSAHRGKGLSTILLESAIKLMEMRKIKISKLSTGIYSFYARLGWKENTCFSKTADLTGESKLSSNIRPMDVEKDWEQLMKIHKEYSSRLNGPVIRNDEFYWKNWVKQQNMQYLLWEDDTGRIAAYIFGTEEGNVLYIQEFGALKGYEDVFNQMVSHLCALIDREGNTVNFPAVIKSSFANEKATGNSSYMLRLVTPFKVNGVSINNTDKLIEIIHGNNGCNPASSYVYWRVDGF